METNTATTTTPCAEIVTFRLSGALSKAHFLEAAQKTLPVLQKFGGCLNRNLSVDDKGVWTDYILWKDHETAMKAAEVVPKDPRFADFGAAVDPGSVDMRHATVDLLWQPSPVLNQQYLRVAYCRINA